MIRKNSLPRTVLSVSALALVVTGGLLIAGPLDPPAGPVTSTYKTLAEVEPRIAINATNTPGDANSVFKISQPGSYYLTGNITGEVGKHGIKIVASGVTLDLNGFDLVGVTGSLDGVSVTASSLTNIAVVNGSVRNWGLEGVDLAAFSPANCRVEGVHASECIGAGIVTGIGAKVTNCTASNNINRGISTGNGSTVLNCTAYSNNGDGIQALNGSTVSNCSAYQNGADGIFSSSGGTISNCSAFDNGSDGILAGNGCTVSNCSADENSSHGIAAGNGSMVSNCSVSTNSGIGIFLYDAIGSSSGSTVSGCTVSKNAIAGVTVQGRSLILNSTISATTAGPGVTSDNQGLRIEGSTLNGNSTFGVLVNTFDNIAELAVVGCTINGNGTGGLSSEASTQVLDSHVSGNTGPGISITGSGLIRGCTINSNTESGIELIGNANVVQNNTLSSNAVVLATAAGILVQGTDNTIDGNRLYSNTQGGIKLNTSGNLVLRNYLARTGATITAVGGNAVAQILTPGAGFVSTDPNANLTY
jgi:parallel beta-helix repeat protein